MQDDQVTIAMLPNVGALQTLVDNVMNRHLDLPGMATFYGPSGDGKSMAGVYVASRFDAALVECKSTWTKKHFCEAVLKELECTPKGTINDMAEWIGDILRASDKPLIVDEADYLVQRNMVEIVRDIYEMSKAPIILIGEEELPQKLSKYERIHNRMLEWVSTQPATMGELDILAPLYAPGVEITDDLRQKIMSDSRANVRRISTNLNKVGLFAQRAGLSRVTLDDWGNQPFLTGIAPIARGFTRARKLA